MYGRQSNLEVKDNLNTLKDDCSSRTDPSMFSSIVTALFYHSNKIRSAFPAFKSTKHLIPQSTPQCPLDQIPIRDQFPKLSQYKLCSFSRPRTPVVCLNPLEPSVNCLKKSVTFR